MHNTTGHNIDFQHCIKIEEVALAEFENNAKDTIQKISSKQHGFTFREFACCILILKHHQVLTFLVVYENVHCFKYVD